MNSFTIKNQEFLSIESPVKIKDVIVLIDNRYDTQYLNRTKSIDFRGSAFKETQVDPYQAKPDMSFLNDQYSIVKSLRQRVLTLETRVRQLEIQNERNNRIAKGSLQEKDKKNRRKFSQMARNYQCPHSSCGKIYGSQTSLKNHLKIKHNIRI